MAFVAVLSAEELGEGELKRVESGAVALCLARWQGEVYAVEDTCTHADWSLADGVLERGELECSLHGARFCVRTGSVRTPPATRSLAVYPVRVIAGAIEVDIASSTRIDD